MKKELGKIYDPKQVEDRLYSFWLEKGYFHAAPNPEKKPYTIMMPPPNITGQLHMGHALDNTLQDVLIRWRRMQGYEALWLPGTDHAAIATEAKIVEAMRAESLTKEQLGRQKFLERAWQWNEKYGGRIVEQLKKLGCSCDWKRRRFTMDAGCSKAVNESFARLYNKGLIYKGERIVNWCPHCLTTISDAEVEYAETDGNLWHIKYPLKDGSGHLEVATTRPETMLGDTAVAVNPDDQRYGRFVGKTVILPLMDREIPIVADNYVDIEFGTGAVKITPAHDPNDFEVAVRHNLPMINVMEENAVINELGGTYAGMDRYEARKRVVSDLQAMGLLACVREHKHNVGSCYRCGKVVEPRLSKQWFVKMAPLATPAISSVKNGSIKFVPGRFDKIYFNWMENIKDWCISRQLWWGHQIPAWYCGCGEMIVSKEDVDICPKCGGKLTRDPDTLDTWFSSALWPFSTLGWPDKTPEMDYFYPTSTLITAYEIIFFWVARMIFSGLEYTGKRPFDTVFIHGLIRDAQGRKMSKSLGNGIDPLDSISEYGADALRLALVTGSSLGNDVRLSDDKIKAARNFGNKIWNAARYILMNLSNGGDRLEDGLSNRANHANAPRTRNTGSAPPPLSDFISDELFVEDKWALSIYNRLVRDITENLESFELGLAATKLYDFIWDILCDWYIELTKARFQEGGTSAATARNVLIYIMRGSLTLLHPFMPFITEEIWQSLPHEGESIMISPFPAYRSDLDFPNEEREFERIIAVIRLIRNRRSEMNVPPSKKTSVFIETHHIETFTRGIPFIKRLASASGVELADKFEIADSVQVVTDSARVLIPMGELVDRDKELARLHKERERCLNEIERISARLGNQSFVSKAPPALVQAETGKLERNREQLIKIDDSIKAMKI